MRRPCQRGKVAEDRRHVAVAEEADRKDDEDERKPRLQRRGARPHGSEQWEDRATDKRPADHVMEERGARVEPAVLLVDQERRPGDDEREGREEPPVRTPELAPDE